MSELLNHILSEIHVNNSMEHINWLVNNAPRRIGGTGDDAKAAEYVIGKLNEYGWKTEKLLIDAYNSWPEFSELKVLSPETLTIESLPCCHISSTLPEGLKTELVYLGDGSFEDYEGKDVTGKMVLVEVSYAPATPEKARIAYLKGASGIICMNWGGDEPVICNRALKAIWGNPTRETFKNIPQLVGISITRRAGEHLVKLCSENDKVIVQVKAKATRHWDKLVQPMGILEGAERPEEFVLIGSHIDAWQPGVTCNATGNSVALELARVFAKYRKNLRRSIYLTFWNGHEIAEAAGSTWLVDNYWDKLRAGCVGYVNIDSPGMLGASVYTASVSRELADSIGEIILEKTNGRGSVKYLAKIGDQSFFGLGVPAIAGRVNFDEETIKKTHGATLGWYNHTLEDTADKVSVENLKQDLTIDCSIIINLLNTPVIQYDFETTIKDITDKLTGIRERAGASIELDSILEKVQQLKNRIEKINEEKKLIIENPTNEKVDMINKLHFNLSRLLTNAFYTYADRYQQDSYGLTVLSKPIPLLYPAVEMTAMDPDSQDYKLLHTEVVKNRNRISDSVAMALELTDLYLFRLEKMKGV